MFQEIFYISGIAVNIGILYTLYSINNIKIDNIDDLNCKSLVKKEEEGIYNLHSSQSIGNIYEKPDQEEIVKERLRIISEQKPGGFKNWLNYIPGLVSKN